MAASRGSASPGNGRDFLQYWKPDVAEWNLKNWPVLNHSASDQYGRKLVKAGDTIWIVTTEGGRLWLFGRIEIAAVTDTAGAARLLGTKDFWKAKFHAVARRGTEQKLCKVDLTPVVKSIRFVSKVSPALDTSGGYVNAQQLQAMRILEPQSVSLLEGLWGTKGKNMAAKLGPTSDSMELERRTSQLMALGPVERPPGNVKPKKGKTKVDSGYERDPAVRAYVLQDAEGMCELCLLAAPFRTEDERPYLEVHHVVQLAENGPDTVDNAVAVCPNCHRALHRANNRRGLQDMLYAQVERLEK